MLDGLLSLFRSKQTNSTNSTNSTNLTAEGLFKEDKDNDDKNIECCDCVYQNICNSQTPNIYCNFVNIIPNFDKNKPSILILDDNEGVVSFIIDDINEIHNRKFINKNDYNIITFTTKYAVFNLLAAIKLYGNLNIKYAIIDITIGGGVYNNKTGNTILDGVDAFMSIYNDNLRYLFYTGNKLNPYIKKNKDIIKKYNIFTDGKSIFSNILYKTKFSPMNRIDFLTQNLFNK